MLVVAALLACVALVSVVRAPGRLKPSRSGHRHRKRDRGKPQQELDMGMLVTEVATRLRSGATVEGAWRQSLEHHGLYGAHDQMLRASPGAVLDEHGVPTQLRQLWDANPLQRLARGRLWRRVDSLPATFAVCRMGHATGAPMADILDSCAEGITEAGESRSAREVALAGPQTSARMLATLPIVGIAIGYVLGVDPLDFLFETTVGNVALVAGIAFEIAGLVVVYRMVREAKNAEAE